MVWHGAQLDSALRPLKWMLSVHVWVCLLPGITLPPLKYRGRDRNSHASPCLGLIGMRGHPGFGKVDLEVKLNAECPLGGALGTYWH